MSKTITIDGTEYVPKGSEKSAPATSLKGLEYKIVRTYSAGVFAGYLKSRKGKEGIMLHSRRLWYWSGASSLSQLAMEGVKNPSDCKFPVEMKKQELPEAIEIINCTEEARLSIKSVNIWQQ